MCFFYIMRIATGLQLSVCVCIDSFISPYRYVAVFRLRYTSCAKDFFLSVLSLHFSYRALWLQNNARPTKKWHPTHLEGLTHEADSTLAIHSYQHKEVHFILSYRQTDIRIEQNEFSYFST